MIRLEYPASGAGFHLAAVGTYAPEAIRANGAIEGVLGVEPGWIEQRTGIKQRHHAAHETVVDMAVIAARRALSQASIEPAALSGLIFATTSPSRITPGLGYSVQHRLGARSAAVLDVNAGCAGLVHATHLFGSLAMTNQLEGPVLLVGAERFSMFLDPTDRPTAVLFGDGAGAMVFERGAGSGLLRTAIGSHGYDDEGAEVVIGGAARGGGTVHMDGRYVAEYIKSTFPTAVNAVLEGTGLGIADLDHVVPHQANIKLIREIALQNGVSEAQLHIAGDRYGNTGTASIPMAIDLHRGRFRAGQTVLLIALGGGMNWAAALLRLDRPLGHTTSKDERQGVHVHA